MSTVRFYRGRPIHGSSNFFTGRSDADEPLPGARRGSEETEAIASLQTAARTAGNYLRQCGNSIVRHEDEDEATAEVLYNVLCRHESNEQPFREKVTYPDGSKVSSLTTSSSGLIYLPLDITGNYTVTELSPPKDHLLPELRTQSVVVVHGKVAEVTF